MHYEKNQHIKVGMFLFPNLTQLDLTGPYEVFSRMPHTQIYLLAPALEPVVSEKGLTLLPDISFEECPSLDIIFVPGGPGINSIMIDPLYINFLKSQAKKVKYITSVCTGALVLAAAGLLDGYRATTHWLSIDLLAEFGIETSEERVVIDRNRITGGGVTAGIDIALTIASRLFDENVAKSIQLAIEYNPAPPFHCGHPTTADPEIVKLVQEKTAQMQEARKKLIRKMLKKE
jgi:cyclohexyl-isocyanide hydratase